VRAWQDECERLAALLRRERIDHDQTKDDFRTEKDESTTARRELFNLRDALAAAEREIARQESAVSSKGVMLTPSVQSSNDVAMRTRDLSSALQRELDAAEAKFRTMRDELEDERVRFDADTQSLKDTQAMLQSRLRSREAKLKVLAQSLADARTEAKAMVDAERKEKDSLVTKADELQQQLQRVAEELRKTRGELGQVKSHIAALETRTAQAEANKDRATQERDNAMEMME